MRPTSVSHYFLTKIHPVNGLFLLSNQLGSFVFLVYLYKKNPYMPERLITWGFSHSNVFLQTNCFKCCYQVGSLAGWTLPIHKLIANDVMKIEVRRYFLLSRNVYSHILIFEEIQNLKTYIEQIQFNRTVTTTSNLQWHFLEKVVR